MQESTSIFTQLLEWTTLLDRIFWGPPMLILLLGLGFYLTIRSRGIQFRSMGEALRITFFSKEARSSEKEGDISPLAALMTALAATVGNGNIAGVGTAIAIGGPGAPVYMWLAGLVGMATKYAEGYLGVRFRERMEDGGLAGGPMYYLKNGLKNKKLGRFLGVMYAACGVTACLIGSGNMTQSNSMTASLAQSIHSWSGGPVNETAPTWLYFVIGATIAVLVGIVILKGIRSIGSVAEKLVPAMIFFYFFFAIWIVVSHWSGIPEAFSLIFRSAFGWQALGGAVVGDAVRRGISQGCLSNEAGLGSAAIAQAASSSEDPRKNGLIAMTGVFIDTLLANTLTTLVIVLTGAYMHTEAWAGVGAPDLKSGILVTQEAFSSVFPDIGASVIAFASFLFGYTTLLGWAYYGEKCIEFLGGQRIIMPFRIGFIGFLFLGAVLTPLAGESYQFINVIWNLGNIGNALMAAPNLIGLILLAGLVFRGKD
ncbi:MAG: amino acid carrier protein [Bacteroidota bacterium]